MRYPILIFTIGLCISLFSCESLITTVPESKLPQATKKVALHAYISPQDTVILVKLTSSIPLLGVYHDNGFGFAIVGQDTIFYVGGTILDAKVTITNSRNRSAELPFYRTDMLYKINTTQFPIEPGETYTLTAETTLGNVEASCTVPKDNPIITDYKIDTLIERFPNYSRMSFLVNFDWKDIPGQSNYYAIKADVSTPMLLSPINQSHGPVIRMMTYSGYWDEENRQLQYQTDYGRDGQIFSTPNGIIRLGTEAISETGQRFDTWFAGEKSTIRMEVLNIDKNYYDYHRAVRINNRQDGNPFVEPVPIPTNVKNGLGCFAASNKFILKVVY